MIIEYGAFAGRLSQQTGLKEQNIELEQRMADAITLLGIHGILTEKDKRAARRRLTKRIAIILKAKT